MKIALGTAQFGKHYGISNQLGQPNVISVKQILALAAERAITFLDTAPFYGCEALLGNLLSAQQHHFNIVTKTLAIQKKSIDNNDVIQLRKNFRQSLINLKQDSLYGLLFHHASDLLVPGGEVLYETTLNLKSQGLIKKVGVSVYSEKEIEQLLDRYIFDIIQLPLSIFDQRFLRNGYLKAFKKAHIEIHARSIFLQGLLLMNVESIPDYFLSIKQHFYRYHTFLTQQKLAPVTAALNFVLGIPEIDNIICGVNQRSELLEILEVNTTLPTELFAAFQLEKECYWNPSQWQL